MNQQNTQPPSRLPSTFKSDRRRLQFPIYSGDYEQLTKGEIVPFGIKGDLLALLCHDLVRLLTESPESNRILCTRTMNRILELRDLGDFWNPEVPSTFDLESPNDEPTAPASGQPHDPGAEGSSGADFEGSGASPGSSGGETPTG